mgnify:CR=1 FL=1
MENYDLYLPTHLIFGRGRIDELPSLLPAKGSRILLAMGGGSIRRIGLYDKLRELLSDYEVFDFSGIEPNPKISTIRRAVELEKVEGLRLFIRNFDLLDGTPVLDIKPYIPYADCHPEATEGFTGQVEMQALTVEIPPEQLSRFPVEKRDALVGVLAQDPRPRYQADASRVYGLEFGGYEVKFTVSDQILTVTDIAKKDS